MKNSRLSLPLVAAVSVTMMLGGCTTVKKGADAVAGGTGRVVEGTGKVFQGVGNALGSLAPKRQNQDAVAVPVETAAEEAESVSTQPEPAPVTVVAEPVRAAPVVAEPAVREEEPRRRGNAITRGVGGLFSGFAPKKQQIELEEDEEAKGEVVEVLANGEVIRYDTRRPSINPFKTYPFKPEPEYEGDATTNRILREQAWGRVVDFTEVRLIGDDRVRIDVNSPFIMEVEEMEYLLLARAAGEASRAGFPRFSIVYLNYKGGNGLSSLFLPDINVAGASWIGAYEDLISERENQRLTGNINKVGGKQIEAVVRFLPAEDRRRRETFAATETYLNMLNTGLFDGQYPYTN